MAADSATGDSEAAGQRRRLAAWRPNSLPQRLLISCPAYEVFFGGARGGGKTDGVLGEWATHAARYGANAVGLMVRRTSEQLAETVQRARVMFGPIGAKFTTKPDTVLMPGGGRLNFRYLERDQDAENYQGHSYCVAVGTRIRMADGAWRAIESVAVGEMVATLEGPRRIMAKTEPYQAPCVEALVRDDRGAVLGWQRHPVWHPVLTTAGLIGLRKSRKRRISLRHLFGSFFRGILDAESRLDDDLILPAWLSWSTSGRIDCKASSRLRRDALLPARLSFPVVLHAPSVRSSVGPARVGQTVSTLFRDPGKSCERLLGLRPNWRYFASYLRQRSERARQVLGRVCRGLPNAGAYVPRGWLTVLNFQDGYLSCPGLYDGPLHQRAGSDRDIPPSLSGVENRRRGMPLDELGTIQERNHSTQLSWVHPYTGEVRCLSESVQFGTMELTECGDAWVADLSIENANHYITETGLINKNTRVYVEEAGNFPSPTPILKLHATLRSGAGVPARMRLTGNPGGPGHHWLKARYIDPAPMGNVAILDPVTGMARVYIPSRVADNVSLDTAAYVAQLRMAGSPELVRAWLEGDWDVISGAFFPEFSREKHVILPRELPKYWARFAAMDWGSARPFAVYWFAVSDGELHGIPRGALVVYREWYGSSGQPNVGLRLTAEEVARGIVERQRDDGEIRVYADPAMFAEDGGPSIAERMLRAGQFALVPADNKRVARSGALGGWDQVRARLKGDDDRPALYLFSTCTELIRTLPALQHDPDRPEDLDTEAEDHAADALRYGCMSRPYVRDEPVERKPRFDFGDGDASHVSLGVSITELIKRAERARKQREYN